jgi:hypothetical protein
MSRQHFRDLCGVADGQPWPMPDEVRLQEGTGERYHTPDFNLGVREKVNRQIFARVVSSIMDDVVSVLILQTSRILSSSAAQVEGLGHSAFSLIA